MTTQEEYKALAADILAENDPLLADQLAPNSPWVAGTHLNTEAHHSHHATSNYDPETGKCLDIRPEKLKGLQRMKWAVGVEPGKGDPDRNDLTIGKEKAPKSKGADINDDGATVTQTPMPGPISPNSGTHAEKVAAVRSAALSRHDDALVRLAEKIDAEGIDALKASGRLTIKATTKAGGFRLNPTLTVDGERFRFDRLRASGIPSLSTPEVFMTPTAGKRRSGSGGDGGASELRGGADPLIDDAKPKIHVFGVQGDLPRRHDPEAHRLAEKARKDADALAEKAKAEKAKTDKATSTSKGPMPMPTLPHGEAAAKARARKVAEEDAAARKAKAAFKKAQKLKAKYQLAKMLLDGNSANSAIETVAKNRFKADCDERRVVHRVPLHPRPRVGQDGVRPCVMVEGFGLRRGSRDGGWRRWQTEGEKDAEDRSRQQGEGSMNKDQEWDALTPDQAAQAYPHLEEEMVVCFGLVMTRAEAEDAIRLRRFAQG